MAGTPPVTAGEEQKMALKDLAQGADRPGRGPGAGAASGVRRLDDGADRASLWCAAGYGAALAQRVRPGRGACALRARIAAGPVPVKAQAALRVAVPLLSAPVADRRTSTVSRRAGGIVRREGLRSKRRCWRFVQLPPAGVSTLWCYCRR
jgi:hypothetical protein